MNIKTSRRLLKTIEQEGNRGERYSPADTGTRDMRNIVCILVCWFCCSAFPADEISLAGVWQVNSVGRPSVTCPVDVPGDVHTALFAAQLIPDPYWGCNETNVQWVAKEDWAFARTFQVRHH